MKFKEVFHLPSGRIFMYETDDGYLVESTEMRDVLIKDNYEVRTSQDPRLIWKALDTYENKWLMTVSTQKGCTHNCKFCDVATLPYKGNLSYAEIEEQITALLENTPYVRTSRKAKIGFARMGEPAHNLRNVVKAITMLPHISTRMGRDIQWLPCFNTILPMKTAQNESAYQVINTVLELKERVYKGFLHFQISCNSTNETKRKELFGGANVLSIEEIIKYINTKDISNRTVTLNFIVMKGVEVSIDKLVSYGLNKDKFTVKLIPLNNTDNSIVNELETYANYDNYEDLLSLRRDFENAGIPVVVDAIAKCEEAGLCCGQLVGGYR